jgi:hypothetical protein
MPGEPFALRSEFLLLLRRGDRERLRTFADTVRRWALADSAWYSRVR